MQTRYPDYAQINMVRQRTMDFLYQNGRSLPPVIVDFINALHAVPGIGVEYQPAPDHLLRVYTTEECNQHMLAIHMDTIARLNVAMNGNYDWYLPGACNFTLNYFALPTRDGGVYLPVWEARTGSMEHGQMSMTFTRAWGDAIFNYLRANRFIN